MSFDAGEILIGGKLNFTTKEVISALGSPRLFQRLRYHGWLTPLNNAQDKIYPIKRVLDVQIRMMNGDLPPLLPSEVRTKEVSCV